MTSCREPLAFRDLDLGLKWAWHRFSLDFGGAVSFFSGFLRTADFPWNLPTLFSSLLYCRNIIKVAKFAKFAKRAAVRNLSSIFITLRMARGLLCSANKSRAVLGSVPRQGLLARAEKAKCGGCHYQIDSCSNGQTAAWRELPKSSPFPHRHVTTSPAV